MGLNAIAVTAAVNCCVGLAKSNSSFALEHFQKVRDMRSIASRRNSVKCSFSSVRLRGLFP